MRGDTAPGEPGEEEDTKLMEDVEVGYGEVGLEVGEVFGDLGDIRWRVLSEK